MGELNSAWISMAVLMRLELRARSRVKGLSFK